MFINSHFINFNNNLTIFNPHYNIIRTKFINYYLKYFDNNPQKAIIYSKFYLYYKIFNCHYSSHIMNIIFEIDFIISIH